MPLPNEHSCRLNPPDKYDSFARQNCAVKVDGKCIDHVYGIKDGKSEIQSLRYKTDVWSEEAAKNHCRARGGSFEPAGPHDSLEDITKHGYSFKAQSEEAEIWLYDEIGEGWFSGVTAKQFIKDLKSLGKVKKIHLHLNSPGGDVFEGMAIYNSLKSHKARKYVSIDGLAASIASIIAMAGDEITMAMNSMMMIHEAWTYAVGPASELRHAADMIEKVNETIIATYLNRTKIDREKIIELMKNETWMTANEASNFGFIDKISSPIQIAAHLDLKKFKYRNIPDNLKKSISGPLGRTDDLRQKLAALKMRCQKIRVAGTPNNQ